MHPMECQTICCTQCRHIYPSNLVNYSLILLVFRVIALLFVPFLVETFSALLQWINRPLVPLPCIANTLDIASSFVAFLVVALLLSPCVVVALVLSLVLCRDPC